MLVTVLSYVELRTLAERSCLYLNSVRRVPVLCHSFVAMLCFVSGVMLFHGQSQSTE